MHMERLSPLHVFLFKSPGMKISDIVRSFLHLFFPHTCAGCGNDALHQQQLLCLTCISELPLTNFHRYAENPVHHLFRGRLPLVNATSFAYFTKDSLLQHLLHEFKYKNRKDIGTWLAHRLGEALQESQHFNKPDALIPVPLFSARERQRGYNQSHILCEGLAERWQVPVLPNVVVRTSRTQSQTRKNRIERWQNMEGKFELRSHTLIEGKHLLLVDDVLTTGATLEACGRALLQAPQVTLSVATIGFVIR